MTTALLRTSTLLDLEVFSHRCGLHPDLVRRFVDLGLIDSARHAGNDLWFAPAQVARVARLQRLRDDLALNYAALALVMDLLDRIDQLERAYLRGAPTTSEEITWTPNA